ncbi:protocadherin Fat 4-like [Artemia franciscana]|uniref:protocadherin Fat 4-like n=1 Tax=Artemia franciscana TaxID=6661 RepID=UPI0032DA0C2E
MKTLWNILSYIIFFLKLEHSYCQCTFPDPWLEVDDSNPIPDLNLTFREGNRAAVVSFQENNEAGVILTLYYAGDRGPSFSAISMQAGNCSEGKCTISVPMLDFEINQTPLVIALCSVETVTVTVDLQDVNDNVPFFTSSPSRMNYPENAIGIIEHQICGSDLDKADVPNLMCSVLINEIPSQNFGMVSGQNSNGNEKCFQIEVLKALDFEEQTTYLLEIFLSDGLFNASTYVPLIVDDRPDQPPQWSRFPSIISFPEDTQVGHVIAVFVARDGDLGINQPIRYELREGIFCSTFYEVPCKACLLHQLNK